MLTLLPSLFGSLGLLGMAFWVWMLYDCLKHGSGDRFLWVWVMLFLNIIGAALYFFICWLPRHPQPIPMPRFANRWRLRDALWQAEAEVKNIGKAHQYVKLGDVLFEMCQADKAAVAYAQALTQEPYNPKALWGAATVEINRKNFEAAKAHLQTLVEVSPDFSYGDGSLAYGQVLFKLGDLEAAENRLS